MAALAFEESIGKLLKAEKELFNECKKYIKSQLELMPNNEIEIDYNNISSTPSVLCDAGFSRYIESNVEKVYLKHGDIYIDTEDAMMCSYNCFKAEDLSVVAIAVKETIEANFDNGE